MHSLRRDSFTLLRELMRWRVALVLSVLIFLLMIVLGTINTHLGFADTARLATAVKAVYDRIAQVRSAQPSPVSAFPGDIPATSNISAAPIEEVFGMKSQTSNGMVKIVVGRKTTMHGVEVGNEMGVNTWAAFAGTDQQAVVDGDFAMLESELQAVLKTMRAAGINIVAIHQHMTNETPRYVFLHYWGKGRAVDLARAVKKALGTQRL